MYQQVLKKYGHCAARKFCMLLLTDHMPRIILMVNHGQARIRCNHCLKFCLELFYMKVVFFRTEMLLLLSVVNELIFSPKSYTRETNNVLQANGSILADPPVTLEHVYLVFLTLSQIFFLLITNSFVFKLPDV